jgi:hypothetical protein
VGPLGTALPEGCPPSAGTQEGTSSNITAWGLLPSDVHDAAGVGPATGFVHVVVAYAVTMAAQRGVQPHG